MTPELFQDALCAEIRKLLSGRTYKKPPKELDEESFEEPDLEMDEESYEEPDEEMGEESTEESVEETITEPVIERVPITVYPQNIPVPLSEEEADPVPYIIVRLNTGTDGNTHDSKYILKVVVIMGIWDDDRNAQGHRELLNIINLVYERFKKNPCLDGKYVYEGGFKWDIQEDGYYPYYFGAFEMDFAIPAIRREDPFT